MVKNDWVETNRAMIEKINRYLIEASFLPQYQNFPIRNVQHLISGMQTEINRLTIENNDFRNKLKNEK